MLVLASASPRRRELLKLITTEFEVAETGADETPPPGASPERIVLELSRRKAEAAARRGAWVIGADTIVALREPEGWGILGKPRGKAEAAAMLRKLSGRSHVVWTGVTVIGDGIREHLAESAEVEFIPLREEEIAAYIATGEPMDKAGAYGIQGRGARFVRRISGDFYAVMGLPVCGLYKILAKYPELGGIL